MKRIHSTGSAFCSDDRGAIAIIFALSISAIFGTVALSVDYSRYSSVRTKVWQALDRAALAGAKLLDEDYTTDAQITDRTTAYFKTQLELAGVNVATDVNLTVGIDRTNNAVTAAAKFDLPTSFAGVVGIKALTVDQTATASYKLKKIELALALDVTGSMAEVPTGDTATKMESLKIAAKDIVDTMFDLANNDTAIRVALAPYSNAVNVGSLASSVATSTSWSNTCVVERAGSDNATDAFPSGSSRFPPFDAPMVPDLVWTPCPTPTIIPLVGRSQRTFLKSEIDSFTPMGGTAGHLGTAWGWYLLSNSWSSLLPTASRPSAPGPDVVKNLVIMSDGMFNMAYITGAQAYDGGAVSDSYKQFRDLCDNAKAHKVNIYTVGFGLGSGGSHAETELKKCASSDANFFAAANSAQLKAAFSAIANRISQLRISK